MLKPWVFKTNSIYFIFYVFLDLAKLVIIHKKI